MAVNRAESRIAGLMTSAVQSAERDDYIVRRENRMLRAFMDRAAELRIADIPPPEDRLAWWEMMQHHGAPTRLLDWTASPFVALWFAISDPHIPEGTEAAALWIFDKRKCYINHREKILELDREVLDARTWQNRFADWAISEGSPVPVVVEASRLLPRAVAQQSVLTLVPDPGTSLSINAWLLQELAVKARIPLEWRPDIASSLVSMGINRNSLFVDLDSLGVELCQTLGF